ncbi:MAG: FliH/SctL family protein [Tepidisphaeraceae bacterium]
MGLIKSTSSRAGAPALFNLADIEASAQAMVARARAQADQLLAAATQQAEQTRASAYARGLAEGKAEGLKVGREQGLANGLAEGKKQAHAEQKAKLTELVATLTKTVAALDSAYRVVEEQAKAEALQLALAIAQRVCKTLGKLDVGVVEANVREAIRILVNKQVVRVSVHPTQRDGLFDLLPQLKLAWPQLQHVDVLGDESVQPGGCRVASGAGEVDATIDGQLDRLVDQLAPTQPSNEPMSGKSSVTQSMSADEVLD